MTFHKGRATMRRTLLRLVGLSVVVAMILGCSATKADAEKKDEAKKADDKKADDNKDEGEGLHGGVLFAPGGKHVYHLELKLEKDKPAYLYLLDSKAKKHVATTTKMFVLTIKGEKGVKVEFKADPQKGDPEGESSRFSAAAGKVPEKPDLEKVEISGEIKGKQYHFTLDKD